MALMQPYEIRSSLTDFWYKNFTTVPTMYPNTKFPDVLKQSPFVTFEIEFNPSQTVGIGGRLNGNRHKGFLAITVNVPRDTGNKEAYQIADEVVQLLSGTRIAQSISFNSAWIDDEQYRQEHFTLIVLAPFKATVG